MNNMKFKNKIKNMKTRNINNLFQIKSKLLNTYNPIYLKKTI